MIGSRFPEPRLAQKAPATRAIPRKPPSAASSRSGRPSDEARSTFNLPAAGGSMAIRCVDGARCACKPPWVGLGEGAPLRLDVCTCRVPDVHVVVSRDARFSGALRARSTASLGPLDSARRTAPLSPVRTRTGRSLGAVTGSTASDARPVDGAGGVSVAGADAGAVAGASAAGSVAGVGVGAGGVGDAAVGDAGTGAGSGVGAGAGGAAGAGSGVVAARGGRRDSGST